MTLAIRVFAQHYFDAHALALRVPRPDSGTRPPLLRRWHFWRALAGGEKNKKHNLNNGLFSIVFSIRSTIVHGCQALFAHRCVPI